MLVDKDFELLEHYKATAEEKAEQEQIMRRGNAVLNTYLEQVKAVAGAKYSRLQYRKDLFAAIKAGSTNVFGIEISKTDLALILKVRSIEYNVICSYAHLIFNHAKRWTGRNHGSNLTFEDFYIEATMAVSNAIYGFTKPDVVFSTFAVWAIHRGILNAINNNKPLCPWTQENKSLYKQFSETRSALVKKAGVEVSFEEVVEKMNLEADEVRDLRAMLIRVVNHSELTANHDEDSDYADSGIYGVAKDAAGVDEKIDAPDVSNVKMTNWERIVFDAWLADSSRGWATRVAKENGKSRRAPQIALERVLARIRTTSYMAEAA
jgi:DNA-directed RNA polymerase specialized sigma subunit